MKWWQESVVYQIYTRSFQDTNNDGIGDIPGIIMHLDNLQDLGVTVIWLSPVYQSPNEDNGYDISDYRRINSEYGTMADMDQLIIEADRRGIKIIMDLVINHTSTEHEWFQKSRNRIGKYEDYYIWKASPNKELPNNWTSFFGEKSWSYDHVREEYYLHLFAKEQADLNYHHKDVLDEVKDIMRFWLDKGIAGFRCDVINILYKNSLEDGKKSLILIGAEHYLNNNGTHKIIRELHSDVLDDYDCFTVGETVFATLQDGKDLTDSNRKELNMIFAFEHVEVDQFMVKWFKKPISISKLGRVLSKWQLGLEWNANYFECHDQLRAISRYGDADQYHNQSGKLMATLLLTLKGTPFIFQGQELGMTNFDYKSMEDIEDVESRNINQLLTDYHVPKSLRWKMIKASSRDNARTPMQWNDGINAGFSMSQPWLKVNSNYKTINMEEQLNNTSSIRSYYKELIEFRKQSEIILKGDFRPKQITKHVFVYERRYCGQKLTIALNFSNKTRKIESRGLIIKTNYNESYRLFEGELKAYEAVILE